MARSHRPLRLMAGCREAARAARAADGGGASSSAVLAYCTAARSIWRGIRQSGSSSRDEAMESMAVSQSCNAPAKPSMLSISKSVRMAPRTPSSSRRPNASRSPVRPSARCLGRTCAKTPRAPPRTPSGEAVPAACSPGVDAADPVDGIEGVEDAAGGEVCVSQLVEEAAVVGMGREGLARGGHGGGAVVMERPVSLLQLSGGEPKAQELGEEAEEPGLDALDLDADPHQWLREFAERVPARACAGDEPGVLEFADLFGRDLLRHQAGCSDVLHGDRSCVNWLRRNARSSNSCAWREETTTSNRPALRPGAPGRRGTVRRPMTVRGACTDLRRSGTDTGAGCCAIMSSASRAKARWPSV